jgi:hypothetical protein
MLRMSYETLDGCANIDLEDEEQLRELFLTPEVVRYLEMVDASSRAEAERGYLNWAREWLKELASHPRNASEGGVMPGKLHFRIPGTQRYFFSIKQAVLSLAVSAGPAAAVALLVPPLLILKLVPASISAGKALWDAAASLSDSDLDVYTAASRAIDQNSLRTLASKGATLEDIEGVFETDPKLLMPKNLKDKLNSLCERNILTKDAKTSSVTQYFKKL